VIECELPPNAKVGCLEEQTLDLTGLEPRSAPVRASSASGQGASYAGNS